MYIIINFFLPDLCRQFNPFNDDVEVLEELIIIARLLIETHQLLRTEVNGDRNVVSLTFPIVHFVLNQIFEFCDFSRKLHRFFF